MSVCCDGANLTLSVSYRASATVRGAHQESRRDPPRACTAAESKSRPAKWQTCQRWASRSLAVTICPTILTGKGYVCGVYRDLRFNSWVLQLFSHWHLLRLSTSAGCTVSAWHVYCVWCVLCVFTVLNLFSHPVGWQESWRYILCMVYFNMLSLSCGRYWNDSFICGRPSEITDHCAANESRLAEQSRWRH